MTSHKGVDDINTLIKKKFKNGLFNHGQDIVMAFSPPVVCCLVKKGCQKGGSRAPQDSPLAMPMKTLHFRCPSVAQKRFFMLATGLKIEQPSVAKTTSTDDFRASESKVKLDAATLGCGLIFVKRVPKGIVI